MRVAHYQRQVIKHWWFLVLCVALAGLGAVINLVVTPTTYAVRTKLVVDFPATSVSITLGVAQYIATQITYVKTEPFLSEVAASIPGVTEPMLAREVSADPISNTQLFEIVVTDTNPTRGALIANTVAQKLIADAHTNMLRLNSVSLAQMQDNLNNAQHDFTAARETLQQLRENNATPQQIREGQAYLDEMQTRYLNTLQGMVDLEVTQAIHLYLFRVVEPATATAITVQPPRTLVIGLALSLGLLAGLIGLLATDIFNEQFRPVTDATDVVPWETLGCVKTHVVSSEQRAAIPDDREGFMAAFKSLRFLDLASATRSIAVVSVGRDDATSEVAAGLALAAAVSGQRTLLVDAAFPGGSQAQRFGVSQQPGLTEALLDARAHGESAALESYLQSPVTLAVPDLRILTTGAAPAVAPRLAGSPALREQVYTLAQRSGADVLILDLSTPGRVHEMAQLAAGADAVVVVVDLSVARRVDIARAAQALDAAKAPVVGYIIAESAKGATPVRTPSAEKQDNIARAVAH